MLGGGGSTRPCYYNVTELTRPMAVFTRTASAVRIAQSDRVRFPAAFTASKQVLGHTQPPIKWILGALSPGLMGQGREGDHSPLQTCKENVDLYILSPIRLHGALLNFLRTGTAFYISCFACLKSIFLYCFKCMVH
jgi:hypothetical protein